MQTECFGCNMCMKMAKVAAGIWPEAPGRLISVLYFEREKVFSRSGEFKCLKKFKEFKGMKRA